MLTWLIRSSYPNCLVCYITMTLRSLIPCHCSLSLLAYASWFTIRVFTNFIWRHWTYYTWHGTQDLRLPFPKHARCCVKHAHISRAKSYEKYCFETKLQAWVMHVCVLLVMNSLCFLPILPHCWTMHRQAIHRLQMKYIFSSINYKKYLDCRSGVKQPIATNKSIPVQTWGVGLPNPTELSKRRSRMVLLLYFRKACWIPEFWRWKFRKQWWWIHRMHKMSERSKREICQGRWEGPCLDI